MLMRGIPDAIYSNSEARY